MLPTLDLVVIGISVVICIVLCTIRLRLVLWADTLYSIIAGGFLIYYAEELLKQICDSKVPVDKHHEFLLDTRAILMMMPAFTWLFCRTTVDISCRTAITFSRLVSHFGAAIVMVVDHFRTGLFTLQHLIYCLLPTCLWTVIMLVQLVRTGSRVNIHIRRVDINKFLTIDLMILLLLALLDLTVPGIIGGLLNRPADNVHIYLHRINGCAYLGLAALPWIGQRFRYSEDKHTVLLPRVLVGLLNKHSRPCSLIWFGGTGYAISKKLIPLALSTYVSIGLLFLLFFPSLIANLTCQGGPFSATFWSSDRKPATTGPPPS